MGGPLDYLKSLGRGRDEDESSPAPRGSAGRFELEKDSAPLRDPATSADRLTVGGLGLGDLMDGLTVELLRDGACPDGPFSTIYSSHEPLQVQKDGDAEPRDYPLKERLDDVRRHGGWLEIELDSGRRARFAIAEERIAKIVLTSGWPEALAIGERADIERVFGANDRYGRAAGKTTWSWPERRLAVVWDDDRAALASLVLGSAWESDAPLFSAVDFIRLALDWRRRFPDDDRMSKERSGSDAVKRQRFLSLNAALQALPEADPSLDAFFSGSFLALGLSEDRVAKLHAFFTDPKQSGLSRHIDPEDEHHCVHSSALRVFWQRSLALRLHMERICCLNEGVLEASGLYRLTIGLAEDVARGLEPARDSLDRALAFVLDPNQAAFSWGRLVRDYGFPDDDLMAIEIDELC